MAQVSDQSFRVLYCGRDHEKYLFFKDLLTASAVSSVEFSRCSDDCDGTSSIDALAPDVCVLDAASVGDWREHLRGFLKSYLAAPLVILTDNEDREFELEALRLGVSECAVWGRLTRVGLDRIIRHATFRRKIENEIKAREADLLIQERLAAVGMLASGMAHEIGTPLGVIRGRAEVSLMRHSQVDGLQRELKIIIEQADRISGLMKSLLNLARGDDYRNSSKIDLRKASDEVLDLMSEVFRLADIEVIRKIPSGIDLKVHAESGSFHQILLNLFQNALHAIEVEASTGRTQGHFIRIEVKSADSEWHLEVEDSGCGMGPEVLRKLFRPFFTTRDIGKGIGLGLSLSYRIVESWKGSIQVESSIGKGSLFRIRLPKSV